MNSTIMTLLKQWNTNSTEREKLQWVYLLFIVASVIIAGLVGLINYRAGQTILKFTLLAVIVFAVNAVVWAVLQTAILSKLKTRANRK